MAMERIPFQALRNSFCQIFSETVQRLPQKNPQVSRSQFAAKGQRGILYLERAVK
jgi:hypothetical protein